MKTRIALLAILAALCVVPPARAQTRKIAELNPFVGYLFGGAFDRGSNALFNTKVDVEDHTTYGARFGFPVTSLVEIEFEYSRTSTAFVTPDGGTLFGPGPQRLGDLDIDYYLGYATFNFGHNWRIVPYATVGAGVARLDPRVEGSIASAEHRFTASAGGGVKMMFNEHFGLRFDGRHYVTLLDKNDSNDGPCDNPFDDCHNNRDWLLNLDLNGGFVFAF
jgi:hypothetical protein